MLGAIKQLVPDQVRKGVWAHLYAAKSYAALIEGIGAAWPRLELGSEAGVPWLEARGESLRIHGFESDPEHIELYGMLRKHLPQGLPASHFRIVRDYVTRWVYPHMRPDLGPHAYSIEQRAGFHGQHRDDVAALADPAARQMLARAFTPKANDVVIDCGAFIGIGAIHMGRAVAQGRVLAVEASGTCHALLARNVAANGASNVVPLHRGIWHSVGTMELETTVAQGNSLVKEVVDGKRTETVATASIDSLVAEHGLDQLDMLSLTLNGAEVEALEGARHALRQLRPRIRAAGWYKRGGRPVWESLKPLLEAAGYEVHVGPRGNVLAVAGEQAAALRAWR